MAIDHTPSLATLAAGVIKAVAAAALIGGGTMVLHNSQESALQRQELSEHDRRITAVEKLGDRLEETNKNVIILNERLRSQPNLTSR
jgi:hypothetical protein